MTAKRKRIEALEARQAVRASAPALRLPQPDTLYEMARRVCFALPEDLQATVKAGGARGYADLLEAWWEADRGEDLNVSARAAYRLAFEGTA
ncbi:hypothetical protein [Deinococcus frigens]|uniref:hypothetical protein n=1 Tax=Deinococcus frigens TaxID=249403 RepID=UPI0004968B82|nr:hypothetical protein [Deinococcus frigens]